MQIKDLVVGTNTTITLAASEVSPKKTRAGKDYLNLKLFDGTEYITGNYWDWKSGKAPAPNTVLDITAVVDSWQGNKQLNIKSIVVSKDKTIADFMPKGEEDLDKAYADAYELAVRIGNDTLRSITLGIIEDLNNYWMRVPGAKTIHHAFKGGTLVHSTSVAKIALGIAKEIPDANTDLCVAGALLHDVGKLFTYSLDGLNISMTAEGMMFDHIYIGTEFISNYADNLVNTNDPAVEHVLKLLKHIILSHHGKKEYGSPVQPLCMEAYIVNAADQLDASLESIREVAQKSPEKFFTEKVFSCGNLPHINPVAVYDIMHAQKEDVPF